MCNQDEMELPSHLVRITADEDFTQQLKLPTGFIKLFDGVVPTDRIILIKSSCRSGRCWWIKMVQNEQDDLFLQDGWLNFVENNSLEYGDSILFEKIENSQLVFTIFGPTGNQKGLPNNSTAMNIQQQEPVRNEPLIGSSDSNHDSEEMSLDAESANIGPDDNGMTNIDEPIAGEGESPVIKPLITELSEAFLSDHPFFTISISKSYLGQLNIPVEFAKNYLPESAKTCTLLHGSGEDMGTFELGIRYYPYGCMRKWMFTRGWIPFVRAIGLLEGDACAFELIEKDEMKMKVSIFRDIGGRPGRVIEI